MTRLPPLLILNTNLPVFPGGGGVEALTTRQLAGLSERVGLVSMVHGRSDLEHGVPPLVEAGVRLYLWENPAVSAPAGAGPREAPASLRTLLAPWLQRLVDWLRAGRSRPADTFVFDRGLRNLSAGLWRAYCDQEWPIVSVVESTAAAFLDSLPRPGLSVLVMHDVRSLVYERQAASAEGWLERARLRREARRYRAFEARYCQEYDVVATVSQHDARWIAEHHRPRCVIAVPLPVDAQYFAPSPADAERPGRIVFTGQMNHPPNADAAVFFAREVLPLVRQAVPEAHFQIVGRRPEAQVSALAALPGVQVTGEVPDVRPYVAEASVVVVPLRYGSGARQKILEAWCLRKCIVATPLGAEGLDARHGQNLLLAEGAAALASEVVRALGDASLRDQVRDAGRAIALEQHDPGRVAEGYASGLQAALDAREQAGGRPLRVVVDLRFLRRAGIAAQEANRSLLRGLAGLAPQSAQVTVLLPAALRRAWPELSGGGLRLTCEDDLATRLARLRARSWQAVRGGLGIFRDVSPELLWLRRLRRLGAHVALSPAGTIAPDLLPLRHVLLVPEAMEPAGEDLRRAHRVIVASESTRLRLIAELRLSPERVVVLLPSAAPEYPQRVVGELRAAGLSAAGRE